MINWFWRLLQWLTAPSEKEIRESLTNRLFAAGLIVFLSFAPAYSLPLTPDQAEVNTANYLERKYTRQSEELESRFNELVIRDLSKGISIHRMYFQTNAYEREAIVLFKRNLDRTNWDVYESLLEGEIFLKIVRHNTIPE